MTTLARWAVVVLAAVGAIAAPGGAMGATPQLQPIGTFAGPIHVAAPLHEDHLLFVVERAGTIRVVHDGVTRAQPFLDISSLVSQLGEGGLLSVAFPPRYWQTGRFVVYYVGLSGSIQLAEYRRSPADPELADPLSARAILTIAHPGFNNHYGGSMAFGPDGLLYVGTGDGGGGGDPDGNAQNLGSLLGKLLRIGPFSGTPYSIPPTNPFVGVLGTRPEIFAYGLRNPWRFSFDRLTGDLVIGDVGQGLWEEIDAVPAPVTGGLNFGWNAYEGLHAFSGMAAAGAVPPVFEYGHSALACSITGGVVVRDPTLGSLVGRYLYADLCGGEIRALSLGFPTASGDTGTGLTASQIVSFGEDAGACAYVVSLAGTVYRLAADEAAPVPCADVPPETSLTSAPASPAPESVSFAFAASEAGSTFECRVDTRPWNACTSPTGYTLAGGSHLFEVRATDPGGTLDPTPAAASVTTIMAGGGGAAPSPAPAPDPTPPKVEPLPTQPAPHRARGVTKTGTPRADTLNGTARDDTLRGRGGDDVLKGLGGGDLLMGGPGRDKLYGGAANDRLLARDGQPDIVDCGPGSDSATIDARDRVKGCEKVARTG